MRLVEEKIREPKKLELDQTLDIMLSNKLLAGLSLLMIFVYREFTLGKMKLLN